MRANWEIIKQSFIEGTDPGYPALAEKFKVNYVVLKRHAAKERWQELRKLFQSKVQNLRTEKRSEIMASESVQFDSDCLKIARAALGKIVGELKGDTMTVDRIMSALEKAQKVGKLAFGETPEQGVAPQINITVESEKAKKLTEEIIEGKE